MEKAANVVAFNVEWFDNQAAIVRHYRLNHFADGTLEMVRLEQGQNQTNIAVQPCAHSWLCRRALSADQSCDEAKLPKANVLP